MILCLSDIHCVEDVELPLILNMSPFVLSSLGRRYEFHWLINGGHPCGDQFVLNKSFLKYRFLKQWRVVHDAGETAMDSVGRSRSRSSFWHTIRSKSRSRPRSSLGLPRSRFGSVLTSVSLDHEYAYLKKR